MKLLRPRLVRSLALRLIASALLWLALVLGIAGLGLGAVFERQTEAAQIKRLGDDLSSLAAALEPDNSGHIQLIRRLADPRYEKPYSGHYWQVMQGSDALLRSRSLWDQALSPPLPETKAETLRRHAISGPEGQRLIAVERSILLPGNDTPLRLIAALDYSEIATARQDFDRLLWLSLALLGAGLLLVVPVQIVIGLRPLRQLRLALAQLRDSGGHSLAGPWPSEVAPLAEELNTVLARHAAMLERSRRQAADMAHALKTPLAALLNAANGRDDTFARETARQAETMRRLVERHLARARAAGAAQLRGATITAETVAAELIKTLSRLHQDRALDWRLEGGGRFAGDRADLVEMLGNLLDNAGAWARHQVRIRLAERNGRLYIDIDDDGPGMPAARRNEAIGRFARLDETTGGSGLGLAITADIATLYGGNLDLVTSDLGGLGVRLQLPALTEQGGRMAAAAL